MRLLENTFNKGGFKFNLLKRVGDWAIYEKSKKHGLALNYEVVKIFRHEGYAIAGINIEPAECLASSEQWGAHGFTYLDIKSAEKKLDELLKKAEDKLDSGESKLEPDKNITKNPKKPMEIDTDAELDEVVTIPKKRGRKPVIKQCVVCGKDIYTGVYNKNRGRCDTCKK